MKLSTLFASIALLGCTQACYFSVTSSTVGTFSAQHSEPSDHGGAPQTMTGGKGSCSFTANLADGCVVTVVKESGCGSLTFTRVGSN